MNVRKNILVPIAFLTLVGCTTQAVVKKMTTPNGAYGYLVSCDGSIDDWTTCYEAATKACVGKYVLLDRNESSTPTAYGPIVRRNIIVECKADLKRGAINESMQSTKES